MTDDKHDTEHDDTAPGTAGDAVAGQSSAAAAQSDAPPAGRPAAPVSPQQAHSPEQAAAQAAALAEAARAAGAQSASSRSGGNAIAWLALLLALLIGGVALWFSMDAQRRESDLLQRVRSLETSTGQDTTTFGQMRDNMLRQIELETEAMRERLQRMAEEQQRALAAQERSLREQEESLDEQERAGERQRQAIARLESQAEDVSARTRQEINTQLQSLESRLIEQEQRISELNSEDRQSWALAEAQYLLRLANQRLVMTGDTLSAEAMLRSADKILRELDDADLHGLRAALADDLAALRAVPRLDTQGLYLRLDALIQQTNDLVMFELPPREGSQPVELSDDWKSRLREGFAAAVDKLSEYIVISRRDVPVEVLMDPQYEGLVRQNMRMLLEQAQVALLSGNQLLYEQSLERALGWVNQFFKNDEQAARAMAEELRALAQQQVAVELPNLGDSLTALDELLRRRLRADEG